MKRFFTTFVVFFIFLFSCSTGKVSLKRIEAENVKVESGFEKKKEIDDFISPYRKHIEEDLSKVLAYNPYDLTKKHEGLNTPIGNLMAQIAFEMAGVAYEKQKGERADFAILNWGGIRSDIPKGDVTVETAYRVMPFENKLVVVELSSDELMDMARYLINGKKPHPLSQNIELAFNKNNEIVKFSINGKDIDKSKTYKVITIDFLANGGDKMYFLQKRKSYTDLNYKLRAAVIDYFTKIDKIETFSDNRFRQID